MRSFTLLVIFVTVLTSSIAQAASYEKTSGTIVDPILNRWGRPISYSGNNLEAGADLNSAILTYADLTGAYLHGIRSGAITGTPQVLPSNWQLTQGYLIGPQAELSNANLANANLYVANLSDANLTGATLIGIRSGGITGIPPSSALQLATHTRVSYRALREPGLREPD